MAQASIEQLSSQEVVDATRQLNYGTWRFQKNWMPLHIVDAKDCHFIDGAGKRYLDFSSQLMCVKPGSQESGGHRSHNRASTNPALHRAGLRHNGQSGAEPLAAGGAAKRIGEVLLHHVGDRGQRGGHQDCAHVYRQDENHRAVSFLSRVDHGVHRGHRRSRRWPLEPGGKGQGVIFAPEVNCYRCPIGHQYPGCNIACADYIEHMIENESDVAAVIVEPVVGTNGVLVPPPEYFPRLREICDRTKCCSSRMK